MPLSKDAVEIIKKEMAGLTGKAAKAKAAMLSQQFNTDITRVYHHSRDLRPSRKTRADRGTPRAISENEFNTLAWYTIKADFSGPHIAEVAAANGINISDATFNRMLRQRRLSRRQNGQDFMPYQNWQAKFPNHLHQIDSTVSQQFYIADDGSIGYERESERYKNKPGNRKPRVTLILLVDDFSRTKFARFVFGNHTFSWMSFLYEAWKEKEDSSGSPFFGIPRLLYSDNDSVIKSKKFVNAMKLLDVTAIQHQVENPRAKGKVEVAFRFLQEFEKNSKINAWKSIDQANSDLDDYLYYVNNRLHGTTGQAPYERWMSIAAERLRAVPDEDIFRLLHMDSERRQIRKNLTIGISGEPWQLPWRQPFINHVGEMVEIYRYPGDIKNIYLVLDGKEYEVEHTAQTMRSVGGAQEEIPVPDFLKRKQAIAESESPGLKLTGIYRDRHRRPYLPREAKEFDETKIQPEPNAGIMRTRLWFLMELQGRYLISTPPTAEETAWVDSIFKGAPELPEAGLIAAATQLETGAIQITKVAQANG